MTALDEWLGPVAFEPTKNTVQARVTRLADGITERALDLDVTAVRGAGAGHPRHQPR